MIFPFRTSTIFRNRWVALLWAAGICFMAAQVVDSISGTAGAKKADTTASPDTAAPNDPVAATFGDTTPQTPLAPGPLDGHVAR